MPESTPSPFVQSALRTLTIEERAVGALKSRLGGDFSKACRLILECPGRVVVSGMGKSGLIGNKIAATLASTGTPAMTLHPAEAIHGDIGMITANDVVLALSNSGNTEELIALLPALKRKGVPLIALTGDRHSTLAANAVAVLDASVAEEACPLGLAPTSSTTAALALGDALAMALLEARGFTREDFAASHPGGKLGRRLLVRVADLMHRDKEIPQVPLGTPLVDALVEMSRKGFGLTLVVDAAGQIQGVFTDGDLRRTLDAGRDIRTTPIEHVMSETYKQITSGALAVEAARVMQETQVYVLVVIDEAAHLAGLIKMHDLLQANVI